MPELELPNPEELREQARDRFSKRAALTVACYAVALAIASLGGNNTGKEMLMTQQEETNKWAYYQAKAGREHQCKLQKLRLEADLADRGAGSGPAAGAKAQALLQLLAAEEQRYEKEKKEIEKEARALGEKLKVCLRRDPYFDFAEVLLQIAIVAASVSMLAGSRPLFALSLALALLGVGLTINGFGLFVRVPLIDG